MTEPNATYTFLPWVRHGLANRISSTSPKLRAHVPVSIDIEGIQKSGGVTTATVARNVELYGPSDIVGIDRAQISRVEPENWVTNFEPNYLVAIEFYDEDFPWRYSPAIPDDRRLLPWLTLVVLEEGEGENQEFEDGGDLAGRPLSYIVVEDYAELFPLASEGWAWAHAHFNSEFSTSVVETDATRASQAAHKVIEDAPDSGCSRLLCPRKLKPKTAYHVFLIPAFESGRLAGLGIDPKPVVDDAANGLEATSSAWGDYGTPANRPEATFFPYYHRWYFRTAERGDFESLVRLLQPRIVDSRVGQRDVDVTKPLPNIAGIRNPELGGILRLGGALKAPFDTLSAEERAEFRKYDEWADPYPQPFQKQLAAFVNLADSYQQTGPAVNADEELDESIQEETDPLVTPPIYARWHALTERLLEELDGTAVPHRTSWVHDLNLDPRWRIAAGFGTKVIQEHQETFMEAAWDQIGDVLEANRRFRLSQLARTVGLHLHAKHVAPLEQISPGALLQLASPLKARVVSDGITVHHRLLESPIGTTMTSSTMRRAVRPRGRLAKRLDVAGVARSGELVRRANLGEVVAAPPKVPPTRILSPDDLAEASAPATPLERFWAGLGTWIRRNPLFAGAVVLGVIAVTLAVLGFGPLGLVVAGGIAAAAIATYFRARRAADRRATSDGLREENFKPTAVDQLPGSASFTLRPQIDPRDDLPTATVGRGETDNPEAVRFKQALREQYLLFEESGKLGVVPEPISIDLPAVARDIVAEVDPDLTVQQWALSGIRIPDRIRDQMGETFVEAMAYPEFDTPMYEPLVKAGTDLFVPNLHLVEPDSVTLLETNQKFIESYMVGLNHEFARELLWREYPTDQRGSYFRQFWDVRKKIAEADDPEAARKRLKDIRPLHLWPLANDLGDNDNREAGEEAEEELVLVIRGELLKKYPNTIISAQKAQWQMKDGRPDKTQERVFDENEAPIAPLYEARVSPDIYFFGFDLTALEARGDDTVDDEPGWFFRIEEVPGDARFGFDTSREEDTEINVWNDLAWADVMPELADGKNLEVARVPPRILVEPVAESVQEKRTQWESDRHVPLNPDISAAELAYIALQTPVIMAVHASELLPDQEVGDG